jgi:putative DNA primase/helicase
MSVDTTTPTDAQGDRLPEETAALDQHSDPSHHQGDHHQGTLTEADGPTPAAGLFQLAGKVDDDGNPIDADQDYDQEDEVDLAAELAKAKQEAAVLIGDQDQDRLPDDVTIDDDGTVHYHYEGIEADLDLSADHWRELTVESGIDPALVVARGYWTIEDSPEAQKFLRGSGITPKAQQPEHFPGLLVFMHQVTDDGLRIQWKPRTPLLGRDGKPQKYVSQYKMSNLLDVHPDRREAAQDPSVRLWIGEGVKKGDSLATRGEVVVSLSGVWNWRSAKGPLPDWEEIPLKDREVVIVYDSDAWSKTNVLQAMVRLGAFLAGRGASVRYVITPAEVNGTKTKGVDDYLAAGGTVDQLLAVASTTAPEILNTDETFTDASMAEQVADEVMAGRFLWVKALGWLRWDGHRWHECTEEKVLKALMRWSLARFREVTAKAAKGNGRGVDKDTLRGWMDMLEAPKLGRVLKLTRGLVERDLDEFDADPDILNTPSGVVDLQTGQRLDHDPDLLQRKITAADYRPGFTHPDWIKALDALPVEVRDWYQERLGQALTGHIPPDDFLVVAHGAGENGKTTVNETTGRAAGDYHILVSDRVLLANPDQHPTEIMDLQGVRYAVAEETPEARRLAVARLKKTVGTPRIRARKVHRDTVEFTATHSFFLSTNYRPVIEETDRGTWRRLALVRFPFTFRKPGEELASPLDKPGDQTLRDRIKDDPEVLTAALAWMIDGARRWYANGRRMSPPPAQVQADTDGWRKESDQVLAYLDDRIRFDTGRHVMAGDLLRDVNHWLDDRGHRPWSDKTLAARFGDHELVNHHHVEKRKTRQSEAVSRPPGYTTAGVPQSYAAWHGIRFLARDEDPDPDQGEAQPDPATRGVPAVPADSKLSHVREGGGVSELPEHPEHPWSTPTDVARFGDWLRLQLDHPDDMVRTMARDCVIDPTWPTTATGLDELARYVARESGNDSHGDLAIRHAWSLWSGQSLDEDQDQEAGR